MREQPRVAPRGPRDRRRLSNTQRLRAERRLADRSLLHGPRIRVQRPVARLALRDRPRMREQPRVAPRGPRDRRRSPRPPRTSTFASRCPRPSMLNDFAPNVASGPSYAVLRVAFAQSTTPSPQRRRTHRTLREDQRALKLALQTAHSGLLTPPIVLLISATTAVPVVTSTWGEWGRRCHWSSSSTALEAMGARRAHP